jgi:hypothetical protein
MADLCDEIVSEGSRIHDYQLKEYAQSQNSIDDLMCYIPVTQEVFTEHIKKVGSLLHCPGPL